MVISNYIYVIFYLILKFHPGLICFEYASYLQKVFLILCIFLYLKKRQTFLGILTVINHIIIKFLYQRAAVKWVNFFLDVYSKLIRYTPISSIIMFSITLSFIIAKLCVGVVLVLCSTKN